MTTLDVVLICFKIWMFINGCGIDILLFFDVGDEGERGFLSLEFFEFG